MRRAVRDALGGPARGGRARAPLVVGCSGGADSLALTLAAAAVRGRGRRARRGRRPRLQDGSAERAAATVALLAERGIAARVHAVDVAGPGGMEAAARRARQAALRAARPHPDSPILLGHTLDDQAETVLLGLGRGSGAAVARGHAPAGTRPGCARCSTVRRATTRAACAGAAGVGRPAQRRPPLHPRPAAARGAAAAGGRARRAGWPRRSRAPRPSSGRRRRARRRRRPAAGRRLRSPLGSPQPRRATVAGTAASTAPARARRARRLPPALRRRVLRGWLPAAGVTGLTDTHLRAADVLAAHGPDRAGVAVPGGLELYRAHGRLGIRPVRWPSAR